MRREMITLGGIYAGAIAQLYLPAWPLFAGSRPPVLAAVVIYAALRLSGKALWMAVFLAALLHDSLNPGSFGPMLLAFPLLALIAKRIRSDIFIDGPVTHMICGALGALLITLISMGVYAIGSQRPIPFGHGLLRLIGSGLLGMITLPIVSYAMKRVEVLLPKRRGYGWQ